MSNPVGLLLLLLFGGKGEAKVAPQPLKEWTIPVDKDADGVKVIQEFERLGVVESMDFDGKTVVLLWRPTQITHEGMRSLFGRWPGLRVS